MVTEISRTSIAIRVSFLLDSAVIGNWNWIMVSKNKTFRNFQYLRVVLRTILQWNHLDPPCRLQEAKFIAHTCLSEFQWNVQWEYLQTALERPMQQGLLGHVDEMLYSDHFTRKKVLSLRKLKLWSHNSIWDNI